MDYVILYAPLRTGADTRGRMSPRIKIPKRQSRCEFEFLAPSTKDWAIFLQFMKFPTSHVQLDAGTTHPTWKLLSRWKLLFQKTQEMSRCSNYYRIIFPVNNWTFETSNAGDVF